MKSITMFCCLYAALALSVVFGTDPMERQPPPRRIEAGSPDTVAADRSSVAYEPPLPTDFVAAF